jgi:deoxycytidine triphosphate deaminase
MYLLNHDQIRRYVAAPRGTYLDIINFDPKRLQHTSYYFSLGREYEILDSGDSRLLRLDDKTQHLVLPPQGYAVIKSHETFMLSDKVIGLIGPISDFVRWGLGLVHSPFIDPMFHGQLELGLLNRLPKAATVRLGQAIGKVSFFDISDTYPIEIVPSSAQEEKFKQRYPRRDDDPVSGDEDDGKDSIYKRKPWQE